ncbi:MAG: hypothetical protein N3A61_07155, partial [Ignavibacteria bacterium]|nr:hypothetical protein [Ignavibacteria bacterium]
TYPGQISVFDLENTARYQVKKFFSLNGSNIAEIHSSLTVKATGKSEASEGGVNFKFEKPKVNGIGKIYFDLTRHCIKKAESQVSFEINVQIQEAKAGGEKAKRVEKVESKNMTELLH